MKRVTRPTQPVSINWASPQARGLVVSLPLAEGMGAVDLCRRQRPLAASGAPNVRADVFGNRVVSFDGTDDMFTGNPAPVSFIQDNTPCSFTVWLNTSGGDKTICTTLNFTTSAGWTLKTHASGHIFLLLSNASVSTGRHARSTGVVNDSLWHHAVVTYDGSASTSGIKFYIDGVSSVTVAIVNTAPGSLANSIFNVGRLGGGTPQYMVGSMRDLRIYNRELTPVDVAAMYKPESRYDLFSEYGREVGYVAPVTSDTGFFFAMT